MSGLWGFALADPRARADISDLASMGVGAGAPSANPFPMHAIAAGPAAFAAQEFPHRSAAVARRQLGDAAVLLACHGTIFEVGADPARNGHAPAPPRAEAAEALLDEYLRSGPDLWSRIRGEFVIAIWDGRDATLRLACDRFRVHPLFYAADDRALAFGSRIAPLLARPGARTPDIDPDSVLEVLIASVIPTPGTIYRGVSKLPGGTELVYRSGNTTLRTYWDMTFVDAQRSGERALAGELRDRLEDAMRVRLAGDRGAAFGAFLSGGIDSTTVLGLATKLSGGPVKSFSIGFGEPRFNEMEYARIAARAYGSEHHEHFVQAADVVRAIPVLLDAYDEPFGNASSIPTYYCAAFAREHGVDILYAGDGGDELFAGNERYSTQRLLDYYHKVPAWLREPVLRPAVEALAATNVSLFVKGAKYIRRARIPYPDRLSSYDLFHVLPLETILEPAWMSHITQERSHRALMARYYHDAPASDDLDRQLYIDLKLTIGDNDVIKVVRATEAAGVAVRFPFLDHRVADFAGTVPARLKMRGTQLRSFFKRAYADFLPPETIAKTKHGFGLPIPDWLRTDPVLHDMMRDLVLGSSSRIGGYFRRSALETLVERHGIDPTTYYGVFLWNLMILELWLRRHDARA
jgi:asparagine synthase (glutamine-hydrolysing)